MFRLIRVAIYLFFLFCYIGIPQVNASIINLSLNPDASATANQVDPSYPASLGIDDDTATFWRSTSHGTQVDPKWLIVDLGNTYSVDHIELWGHDSLEYAWFYIDYNVLVSTDGQTFTFLESGRLTDPATVNPPTAEYYDYFHDSILVTYESSLMRYVKFEVYGGSHDAHLNEIEIWGESSPVPSPPTIRLLLLGLVSLGGIKGN